MFFYNVRVVNITSKESAALVIQEVSVFFGKKHEFLLEELTTALISYSNYMMNESVYRKI